jgi:hypothetical protein
MVGGSPGPPPALTANRTTGVPGGSPGAAGGPFGPPGVDIDRVAAMLTTDKGESRSRFTLLFGPTIDFILVFSHQRID